MLAVTSKVKVGRYICQTLIRGIGHPHSAAIPRFSIRIRMRIRKISMRTPYSTFQYPSNVSACVYITINSAYIISLSFTWKCNVVLSTMWWTVFLSADTFNHVQLKAAIPRFSIRMRISMRIRKISMRTPYPTFQYPSSVSVCFYLTLKQYKHFGYIGEHI